MDHAKIVECPRDAWQGLREIIPTETKVSYLAQLLRSGFGHIDAVSFVSPKHVPQMADSEAVMQALNAREPLLHGAEIIGIVVNEQGFRRAIQCPGVTTIGYPYSLSETFSRQNANMSLEQSRALVEQMQREIDSVRSRVQSNGAIPGLVIYVSMAFGNPYGEPCRPQMVAEAVEWLKAIGIRAVSLADTVGKATAEEVGHLFRAIKDVAENIEIGVHLHSRPAGAAEKVLAAYEAGCRRFDSALTGLGGCPFAGDELVGNIPTEIVIETLAGRGVAVDIDSSGLAEVLKFTREIRGAFAHQ